VWASHYRRKDVSDCFGANRAFRAWGHQFLYNFSTLELTLCAAGFDRVIRREYGESEHPELRGIEHHEKNEDFEGISHILIVEAWGRGADPADPAFVEWRDQYLTDLNVT
jgi:hypothetical protein